MTVAEVIARSLIDLNIEVVTHVPGHGGTQTFEAFREVSKGSHPISFHEEVAYTIAHSAAVLGNRSCCLIKTHGFVKAMNSVVDALSCSVRSAFITVLFEDRKGKHSDNIFSIAPILEGSRVVYQRSKPERVQENLFDLVRASEVFQLPVCLIVDADDIDTQLEYLGLELPASALPDPRRNIAQHLVTPIFAEYQHKMLKMRLDEGELPDDPQIKSLNESLPPAYLKAVEPYLPVFEAFKDLQFDFVSGDAGVSTLSGFPPYNIVSIATYMGGSLPLAIGAYLTGKKRSWAFTGDFSFIAAGHLGLIEAIERKIPLKVLIYANGKAQTTGGQSLDLTHLDRLLAGYEKYVRRMATNDAATMRSILHEANEADELRIVVATF